MDSTEKQLELDAAALNVLMFSILKFSGTSYITLLTAYSLNIESGILNRYPNDISAYSAHLNSKTIESPSSNTAACLAAYGQRIYPFEYRCSVWYK